MLAAIILNILDSTILNDAAPHRFVCGRQRGNSWQTADESVFRVAP
jgi:hypothetical protein